MCDKLKQVLPDIISPTQGAFVAGRSILHNVMIFQDIIKSYTRGNAKPSCVMKLDLKKAYDTVEWGFIEEVMKKFGFPHHFIQLVMTCLTTTQYSLLINGVPSPLIQPKRGLRHGDPLSPPLLSTLYMEYFSRIMKLIASHRNFKHHSRCKRVNLNHLCFADDLLLFCHGDVTSFQLMLEGLTLFSSSTGLQVNPSKSSIYFCGFSAHAKNIITGLSGYNIDNFPFRYLGVPISPKKIQLGDCNLLMEKMVYRIKVWSSRHFSFAWRMQLVNSVLMSISVYWCQLFLLPSTIIKKINAICRSYLWFGVYDDGTPGSVNWDKLCDSKEQGGLGFRNLALWNQAAVGKLAWAIEQKQDNLWVKWIHALYVKNKNWQLFSPSLASSWPVKHICKVKGMCTEKLNGSSWLTTSKYSIKSMYIKLCTPSERTQWARYIWNRLSVPKHRFSLWLALLDRHKTKSRLYQYGISTDNLCAICGSAPETSTHLFFDCFYSLGCLTEIADWLGLSCTRKNVIQILNWTRRYCKSAFKRKIIMLLLQDWFMQFGELEILQFGKGQCQLL
ncbi:uncharacterized protein [Spinacia oleracea]|uniref:Reverse transcriptase domain-containing protein n=1 Tax=Spinacia oleracea TaxID=3562 RepID=A0ABM3R3U6_SPIOL|nr:uncharacterized protein LOC130465519 [Spinacia oleracea]